MAIVHSYAPGMTVQLAQNCCSGSCKRAGKQQAESSTVASMGGSGVNWDAPLAAFAPLQVSILVPIVLQYCCLSLTLLCEQAQLCCSCSCCSTKNLIKCNQEISLAANSVLVHLIRVATISSNILLKSRKVCGDSGTLTEAGRKVLWCGGAGDGGTASSCA